MINLSVPKGRRKESGFEAPHYLRKLRTEVTDLMLRQFGFSESKYLKMVEHYRHSNRNSENLDEVVARYEKRMQAFFNEFIPEERKCITDILREITKEFTMANSIFPKGPAQRSEAIERRIHLDRAIGYCFTLKQEIQYALEVLPVDLNQYDRYAELVDKQIGIFKGVRQADNRFFKSESSKPSTSDEKNQDNHTNDASHQQTISESHRIKTYQDVIAERNRQTSQRIPNTSKMNLSSFQNAPRGIGIIQPVLPGQEPPKT